MKALWLVALLVAGCGGRTRIRAEGTCLVSSDAPMVFETSGGWLTLRNLGPAAVEVESDAPAPRPLAGGEELRFAEDAPRCVVHVAPGRTALLRYDLGTDESYFPSVRVREQR